MKIIFFIARKSKLGMWHNNEKRCVLWTFYILTIKMYCDVLTDLSGLQLIKYLFGEYF